MQVVLKPMGVLALAVVSTMLCVRIFWKPNSPTEDHPVDKTSKQHLVGQWNFDEGTGTVASDSSTGRHPGTLQGNAGWGPGLVGAHALSLPGEGGNFVDIPQPIVDITKSFTVTCCVKPHRSKGFQTFVSIDGGQVSGFYLQLRDPDGTFGFTFLPADDPAKNTPAVAGLSTPPVMDQWYRLAGVYDASAHTISLYVNGVLAQTIPCPATWHATGHTLIGRGFFKNPTDFVEGQIDDVRFYDVALPVGDIQSIAASEHP